MGYLQNSNYLYSVDVKMRLTAPIQQVLCNHKSLYDKRRKHVTALHQYIGKAHTRNNMSTAMVCTRKPCFPYKYSCRIACCVNAALVACRLFRECVQVTTLEAASPVASRCSTRFVSPSRFGFSESSLNTLSPRRAYAVVTSSAVSCVPSSC